MGIPKVSWLKAERLIRGRGRVLRDAFTFGRRNLTAPFAPRARKNRTAGTHSAFSKSHNVHFEPIFPKSQVFELELKDLATKVFFLPRTRAYKCVFTLISAYTQS